MPNRMGGGKFRMFGALCTAGIFIFQQTGWAAAAPVVGEISVHGRAAVNGLDTASGKTIFSGDRIVTEAQSTAAVTSRGGARLLVVEASAVEIKDSNGSLVARLDHGGLAAVSPAQAPLIVEVGGMRILPAARGSVYAVFLDGNKLKVQAQSGALDVEAANRTVSLPEGKTLDATMAPAPEGGGGGGASGGSSTLTAVLIASTVALAASTLALAIDDVTKGCTVSPAGVGTCQVH